MDQIDPNEIKDERLLGTRSTLILPAQQTAYLSSSWTKQVDPTGQGFAFPAMPQLISSPSASSSGSPKTHGSSANNRQYIQWGCEGNKITVLQVSDIISNSISINWYISPSHSLVGHPSSSSLLPNGQFIGGIVGHGTENNKYNVELFDSYTYLGLH